MPREDFVPGKIKIGSAVALCALTLAAAAGPGRAAEVKSELLAGYGGGPAGQLSLVVSRFVERSPVCVRLGLGYAGLEPGNAEQARRVFINEATNGTPEKAGHAYTWRLDLLTPLGGRSGSGWNLYAGPRYSRFTAGFKYVGGDEDFDVRCHQWGLGGGADYTAPMTPDVSLRFSGGADYYFRSTLEGHDAAYSPDGQHVNSREDFTYEDADRAINQPNVQFRLLVGAVVRLGPR